MTLYVRHDYKFVMVFIQFKKTKLKFKINTKTREKPKISECCPVNSEH